MGVRTWEGDHRKQHAMHFTHSASHSHCFCPSTVSMVQLGVGQAVGAGGRLGGREREGHTHKAKQEVRMTTRLAAAVGVHEHSCRGGFDGMKGLARQGGDKRGQAGHTAGGTDG